MGKRPTRSRPAPFVVVTPIALEELQAVTIHVR